MSLSCGCNKRVISSNAKKSLTDGSCNDIFCHDVCVDPQCGNPVNLTCLAPVVYDEIGINICRTIPITTQTATAYSTAVYATAEVTSISVPAPTVSYIKTRPNCMELTLSNLSVNFAIKFFDCCKNLLGTVPVEQVAYLTPTATDPSSNPETNPTSVTLELFAPYGISYTDTTIATPSVNVVSFTPGANTVTQGINIVPMAKVLDLDMDTPSVTVGLTLVTKVIYFVQYLIPHHGKPPVSKGSLAPEEASACSLFVNGGLLDRNIKPLEPFNPFDHKKPCEQTADASSCQSKMEDAPFDYDME